MAASQQEAWTPIWTPTPTPAKQAARDRFHRAWVAACLSAGRKRNP